MTKDYRRLYRRVEGFFINVAVGNTEWLDMEDDSIEGILATVRISQVTGQAISFGLLMSPDKTRQIELIGVGEPPWDNIAQAEINGLSVHFRYPVMRYVQFIWAQPADDFVQADFYVEA